MEDLVKRNVLGILVSVTNYRAAVEQIIKAANIGRPFSVTALAVHGVMTGVNDKVHKYRLNHFDLVCPDGQPVRWALNLLHSTQLTDRVYGPKLTLEICQAASFEKLPIYLYGSTQDVLDKLSTNLVKKFPGIMIASSEPSKFRLTSSEEKEQIANRIKASGAKIVFVGLGCPRQEVFAYEYRDILRMPIIAVGAAYDYHAGLIKEPPNVIQKAGLQWLYRLVAEPRRLWKRYVLLNPAYLGLLIFQKLGFWKPNPMEIDQPLMDVLYG